MKLSFINIGSLEVALIGFVVLTIFIAIGNYGRNSALGYWGSVIQAMLERLKALLPKPSLPSHELHLSHTQRCPCCSETLIIVGRTIEN